MYILASGGDFTVIGKNKLYFSTMHLPQKAGHKYAVFNLDCAKRELWSENVLGEDPIRSFTNEVIKDIACLSDYTCVVTNTRVLCFGKAQSSHSGYHVISHDVTRNFALQKNEVLEKVFSLYQKFALCSNYGRVFFLPLDVPLSSSEFIQSLKTFKLGGDEKIKKIDGYLSLSVNILTNQRIVTINGRKQVEKFELVGALPKDIVTFNSPFPYSYTVFILQKQVLIVTRHGRYIRKSFLELGLTGKVIQKYFFHFHSKYVKVFFVTNEGKAYVKDIVVEISEFVCNELPLNAEGALSLPLSKPNEAIVYIVSETSYTLVVTNYQHYFCGSNRGMFKTFAHNYLCDKFVPIPNSKTFSIPPRPSKRLDKHPCTYNNPVYEPPKG